MMMATPTKRVSVKVPSSRSSFPNRLLLQNRTNFKQSGDPSRIMYYEDGSWIDFDGDVVEIFRPIFVEGRPVVEASLNEIRSMFDFLRMVQIDLRTGNQRSIAWIDVHGKCFFPKSFVDMSTCDTDSVDSEEIEIEIDVRVNDKSKLGKRKAEAVELDVDEKERGEQSDESSSNNQENLTKRQRTTMETPNWPNVKLVKKEDRAYSVVNNLFLSGLKNVDPGATISSIHQCTRTGPIATARCEVFRKQMEVTKAARGTANTIFAWYGTSAQGVESILQHGFEIPGKVPGSETYGVGIHLSPVSLPHLSAMQSVVDDNGEKHVILCRVVLGNVEKVEAGSRQSHPSSLNFDTGVDDIKNPKQYIVWYSNMNTHIYPECVVSYKSSDNLSASFDRTALMNCFPNATKFSIVELFSKLESSLPSEKVQDLKNLCNVYKSGKMAKDVFIEQLRVITGVELLRSTIREALGPKMRFC